MLSFHNSKMIEMGKRYGYKTASFDLLAGHTCPMANLCHSETIIKNGHRTIKDYGQFRCYATKAEVAYTNVYKLRKKNYNATQHKNFITRMVREIQDKKITLMRIHSSGDFYDFTYFQKWIEIIRQMPDVTFFAYTKQATFVKWYQDHPLPNFKMTYSYGGMMDSYAVKNSLPHCTVIVDGHNPENLPIACGPENHVDDFEYIMRGESFGIAFH